eukprot:3500995-Karenia_brevis.AAC.2
MAVAPAMVLGVMMALAVIVCVGGPCCCGSACPKENTRSLETPGAREEKPNGGNIHTGEHGSGYGSNYSSGYGREL